MKIRSAFFGHILITCFLVLSTSNESYSQATDISTVESRKLYFGVTFGPAQSQIINEGDAFTSDIISSKKNAYFANAEIGYFFSKFIGVSSGIGFSTYKTVLNLNSYQSSLITKDTENETYELRITGSDIEELQTVDLLNIPFSIYIRVPVSEKLGFFLKPGMNISVPVIKSYKSNGTFTFKGYYPTDNVLLENLPAYGFPTNMNSGTASELELKPLGFNAIVSVGVDYYILENLQIAVAALYNISLSTISDYISTNEYQLSSEINKINSLMGMSTKTSIQSLGLEISLRYYLK